MSWKPYHFNQRCCLKGDHPTLSLCPDKEKVRNNNSLLQGLQKEKKIECFCEAEVSIFNSLLVVLFEKATQWTGWM